MGNVVFKCEKIEDQMQTGDGHRDQEQLEVRVRDESLDFVRVFVPESERPHLFNGLHHVQREPDFKGGIYN